MLFINKLFNSIACLLSFTNLQLVIPGRTWILLYLGRTVYKRLWACLALYLSLNCGGVGAQAFKALPKPVGKPTDMGLLVQEVCPYPLPETLPPGAAFLVSHPLVPCKGMSYPLLVVWCSAYTASLGTTNSRRLLGKHLLW